MKNTKSQWRFSVASVQQPRHSRCRLYADVCNEELFEAKTPLSFTLYSNASPSLHTEGDVTAL